MEGLPGHCPICRRGFSRQRFAASYYLKRRELLEPIAAGLAAGSGHRQLARSHGCAPSTNKLRTTLKCRSQRRQKRRRTSVERHIGLDHAYPPKIPVC